MVELANHAGQRAGPPRF